MRSSCRPASATSRPRSRLLVRVNARETSQTIPTAVLLLVSGAGVGFGGCPSLARGHRRGRATGGDAADISACSSAIVAAAVVRAGSWSVACGTPIIGPAGVSAGAMLVRAASNDAVAAFGASGTIAASHGTSRSIALLTNTLDETRDTRQRDMARSLAFERRQRC